MRILMTTIGSLLLAACTPAATAPTIDGTYKIDVASAKLSDKPDTILLKDGQYECSTCTPTFKVAADGAPHAVEGRDYWDSISVKVVSPTALETTRYRKGAVVGSTKIELSADGQMLTWTSTSSDNAEGKAITNSSKSKRTAPAPAGAHAVSGSWLAVNDGAQISDESLLATISMKDGMVSQKFPTGESYEAKLGGPQVPVVGDKAGATVTVVAEGAGFKETGFVNGKAVVENTMVPTDATTLTLTSHDLKSGETSTYTLKKQ